MRTVIHSGNIEFMKKDYLSQEEKKPDDYMTKLIKYIPSEVVILYITLDSISKTAKSQIPFFLISCLIVIAGIISTILYLWRITKVTDWRQILISTTAFLIWVFALGGPFTEFSWYHPVYGALILPFYTFLIPLFVKP